MNKIIFILLLLVAFALDLLSAVFILDIFNSKNVVYLLDITTAEMAFQMACSFVYALLKFLVEEDDKK